MSEVKVIADSISESGVRLITLQVKFPRFIIPEFNTHRVFSRNFSSSRAIPTKKLLEQIRNNPAMPVHWGKNQAGMQAAEELEGIQKEAVQQLWLEAAKSAASFAEVMAASGAHKQIVNRIIEPFLYVEGIVSATEWENWFGLRAHADAQPEIHDLALKMHAAMFNSNPVELKMGEWHLPYVSEQEKNKFSREVLCKISSARCCRVSYLKHDGTAPSVEDDLMLCDRLTKSVPIHASPFEHVATPMENSFEKSGNFRGWSQYRHLVEQKAWSK